MSYIVSQPASEPYKEETRVGAESKQNEEHEFLRWIRERPGRINRDPVLQGPPQIGGPPLLSRDPVRLRISSPIPGLGMVYDLPMGAELTLNLRHNGLDTWVKIERVP